MIIDWPTDLAPQTARFWLQPNTQLSESPFSRAQQVLVRAGDRWQAQMAWQTAPAAAAARIEALLAQLRGPANQVRLGDWRRPAPRGTGATWPGGSVASTWTAGTAWKAGTTWASLTPPTSPRLRVAATRGAATLATWGWAPSQPVLLAGDYVEIAGQLLVLTADAATNAGGIAALQVAPALRAAAEAGTPLVITRARARFRLVDDDQAANDFQPGPATSFSVALVEALP